jgi:YHS domain-containing protein
MTRTLIALAGILALTAVTVGAAEKKADEDAAKLVPQKSCPIMGGAINKDYYTDVRGQRVYVCCPGCKNAIEKDPEAALKKLDEKGQYAESQQKICPVMKRPINKDLFVEYKGRRLYVCCKSCLGAVKANPEKYADEIAKQVAERKEKAEKEEQ